MRILLTNIKLCDGSGTETLIRDLSLALRRRGHVPPGWSLRLLWRALQARWMRRRTKPARPRRGAANPGTSAPLPGTQNAEGAAGAPARLQ
jgi:hypothetical protein